MATMDSTTENTQSEGDATGIESPIHQTVQPSGSQESPPGESRLSQLSILQQMHSSEAVTLTLSPSAALVLLVGGSLSVRSSSESEVECSLVCPLLVTFARFWLTLDSPSGMCSAILLSSSGYTTALKRPTGSKLPSKLHQQQQQRPKWRSRR